MTFFLQNAQTAAPPPLAQAREEDLPEALPLPDVTPAGFAASVSAGWRAETIRTDAHGYTRRKRNDLALEMYDRLPMEAKARIADRRFDHHNNWRAFEEFILDEAGQVAARDPVAWGDLPLDIDQFDSRIDAARKAELDEAEAVLALPGGAIAEFIGAGARAMTDETSLALLPFGFGGSAARIILTEAALGAAAEAAVLPREFQVADELGLPDPDPTSRILTGAALGGAFAGAIVGGVRGLTYLRERRDRQLVADLVGPEQALDGEAAVAAAEARLSDELPPAAATQTMTPPAGAEGDDLAIVRSIIGVESGGRATAQNPNSSARGLGQFISSTWMEMIRQHRPDLLQGRTPAQVLAMRDDPQLNYEMTVRYTQGNRAALRSQNLPAGPAETYLAHFLGLGGATRALRLPLNAPISEVMSPAAIAANRSGRYRGKPLPQWTVGDLRAWARSKMRGAYGPDAPTDMPVFSGPTTRGYTGEGQIVSGAGRRVDVAYEVVDIARLRQATGELQPRDRSTVNSDVWVAETAARLDPALLMPAPTADRGAPIVGPDGIIESGNGRVRAITRAYEQFTDRGDAYRGAIEALTGQPIPEGIERPVLIARRTSELDDAARRDWVVEAQDSGVAELTPIEAARVGARRLSTDRLNALDLSDPDTIFTTANAATLRDVLADIPPSQRNALFDRDTRALNAEGKRRVRNALFARAWDQQDVVRAYVDLEDSGEFKSMLEALAKAAPDFAVLRAEIEAGLVDPAMDITSDILSAMRVIVEARELARGARGSVKEMIEDVLAQDDVLAGAVGELTAALVRKFYPDGRAARSDDIATFLRRYATEAREAGRVGGFLTDTPSPAAVLRAIDPKTFGNVPDNFTRAERGVFAGETRAVEAEQAVDLSRTDPPVGAFDRGAESPALVEADTAAAREMTEALDDDFVPVRVDEPDTAAAAQAAEQAAARAALRAELGDMKIRLADNSEWSARDILDDLEADDTLAATIDFCVTRAGGANG